jgi:hypothetical protein
MLFARFCAVVACSAAATGAPAPQQQLLYRANFSAALDVTCEADLLGPGGKARAREPTSAWVLESQGNASVAATTAGGRLAMRNNGAHMVLWANRAFPSDYELRFGVAPNSTEHGLAIVFFSTTANDKNLSSIFALSLPPRNGDYANYTKGALGGYSDSYYRGDAFGPAGKPLPANETPPACDVNPHDGKCTANLRKNPGFHLVQQGDDLLIHRAPRDGVAFEVVLRKLGAALTVTVDGAPAIAWTDNSSTGPLAGGFIGLRQMAATGVGTYTHFEVFTAR